LNRHVQATGNPGARQRLRAAVFLAKGHQARHFILSEFDFFAAPFGQAIKLGRRTIENSIRRLRYDLRHGKLL
jgi:hypothetical protein